MQSWLLIVLLKYLQCAISIGEERVSLRLGGYVTITAPRTRRVTGVLLVTDKILGQTPPRPPRFPHLTRNLGGKLRLWSLNTNPPAALTRATLGETGNSSETAASGGGPEVICPWNLHSNQPDVVTRLVLGAVIVT